MAVDRFAGFSSASRRRLRTALLVPSWVVVAVLVVTVAAGATIPPGVQYVPLALSVVVFGLPHGAVDHLAVARARGTTPTRRGVLAVGALYLLLGGAYAALWFFAPVFAAVAFIAMTWFHWGQGDLHAAVTFAGGDHLETRVQRVLFVVVRGGLPMLVPLLGFPETYRRVLTAFVALFGEGSLGSWEQLFEPRVRLVLGGGFLALTIVTLTLGRLRAGANDRGWRIDAAETVLLWIYFLTVPPLLAVGTYFPLWHAIRHVARLLLVDDDAADALRSGRWLPALGRFARDAAPLSALSVVLLAGFAVAVPGDPRSDLGIAALYLVFVAVLTLPHIVVVSAMDRAEGVWRPGKPGR
ncbi:Brp/Blh family beta-carotene 15,15'-dioxygenase [Natrinema ejinorense]|uniref:Probable beta-carotene 15,15'-dioxygenase n=1 Tax=Natrinema ejinorense TaxID=373386 RepID=A0A2A5R087_9EURY|nr:Brp/Blh family beta-carotene 15,15'-dioxygenase [Natrinema ejinorense]PCR92510.1 beta-carotene 15,15'-monooxygenase [Natrinema ejinorense]